MLAAQRTRSDTRATGSKPKPRRISGTFERNLEEPESRRELQAAGGGVLSTGPLDPGDGRIYVLCTSGVFQKIREAVARNKYMLKKWLFDFFYRQQCNSGLDMSAFEELFAPVADDAQSEPALTALEAAYVGLKTRKDGGSSFAETTLCSRRCKLNSLPSPNCSSNTWSRPDVESINALVDSDVYQAWY